MRRTKDVWLVAVAALFVAFATTNTVATENQAEGALLEAATPPGTFLLTGDQDEKVVTYEQKEPLRVCVGEGEHAVGVKVQYDGKRHVAGAGECFEFEAKRVVLKPAAELEEGWDLEGEIENLSR